MKNIQAIFPMIGLLAIAASIFWAINTLVPKIDTYLKLKAAGDCAEATRYETVNAVTGVRVSYPATDLYKACLKDKGY